MCHFSQRPMNRLSRLWQRHYGSILCFLLGVIVGLLAMKYRPARDIGPHITNRPANMRLWKDGVVDAEIKDGYWTMFEGKPIK